MLTDGRLAAAAAIFCTGLLFTCIETNAQSMPKDVAARTEIYAIPSLTISDQQFLIGDSNGRQVTVAGVPRCVALQEHHFVSARGQRPQQRTIGGGVAVTPGGRDRQTKEDELHAVTVSGCGRSEMAATIACICVMPASTSISSAR